VGRWNGRRVATSCGPAGCVTTRGMDPVADPRPTWSAHRWYAQETLAALLAPGERAQVLAGDPPRLLRLRAEPREASRQLYLSRNTINYPAAAGRRNPRPPTCAGSMDCGWRWKSLASCRPLQTDRCPWPPVAVTGSGREIPGSARRIDLGYPTPATGARLITPCTAESPSQ